MSIAKLRELGIMIDCSRNAVVNLKSLKEMIDICGAMGYDFVGLYTEDTIEVENEPYFGYQRGRYTVDEIKEADAYAHERGMELRPYIQTLAHINQIVDYKDYDSIIDVNDILLIGDPRTEELLDHILKTVSEAYSTRIVNIGMDEAHMVGLGKYLEKYGYRDRVKIILDHLDMVMSLCRKYGLKPQMWSDMFFRLLSSGAYGAEDDEASKELSARLSEEVRIPEGLELVYWDYYSTESEHFERILSQHKAFADKVSFAGGAWRWMGFTPYNSYSILSTEAAVKACLKMEIDSYVMTLWGDDGTECSMYAVLPVLYKAAVAGGKMTVNAGAEADEFKAITGYSIEEFMLMDIADPGCEGAKKNNLSKILLFNDPLLGIFDSLVPEDAAGYYADAAKRLSEVTSGMPRKFDQIFRTQELLCLVLEHKADLGIRLRKAYQNGDKQALTDIGHNEIPTIISLIDRFYAAFRGQWMKENKSFGFEVQTIRIGGLKQRLEEIRTTLDEYMSGRISQIEELETKALPVGIRLHGESDDAPEYNRYQKYVTTSRLSW